MREIKDLLKKIDSGHVNAAVNIYIRNCYDEDENKVCDALLPILIGIKSSLDEIIELGRC
jgi:hypothetical protein